MISSSSTLCLPQPNHSFPYNLYLYAACEKCLSTSERIWDTITGSTKQALGNLGSGVSTYLQNSQSSLLKDDEARYEQETKRYAQMLSDNQTNPGTWNDNVLKAKEKELDATKQMLDVGKQAVANSSLVQGANALRDSSAALTRSGAQDIARAKENLGTLGRFAVDVGAAGTQLVGDAFLAGLTGGMGVLPVKAVQAFGSGAEQARAAGANLDQQAAYGLANAALNLGTEKLFNLATPLKKTYGAGLLESPLADTLGSFRKTAPIQMGLSALTEGGEEFAQALVQPLLQKAIYDPDAEFDLNDAFYQGFVGGTVGGLAGGADAISELDLSDGFLSGFFAPEIAELQNSSNQYFSDDTVPSASIESSSQKDYTEFDKYTSVLQELAPSSLDEFLDIKNDPENGVIYRKSIRFWICTRWIPARSLLLRF